MKIIKDKVSLESDKDSFLLKNFMSELKTMIKWEGLEGKKFTIDIYNYLSRIHPDDHLGWWKFDIPEGKNEILFKIDFREKHIGSILMQVKDRCYTASDAWINKDYMFSPLQDFLFTVRNANNELIYEIPFIMKIDDYMVMKEFYHKLHKEHKYTDKGPFLWIMHEHKLKILKKIFTKYIKENYKVLDVGCGRSLFTEIKQNWLFQIYAGDIEYSLILSRKKEFSNINWLIMDANQLPFKRESFDVIFAGEIIEHMPEPIITLSEWRNMLHPGGLLILTTPNKDRSSNVINKIKRPFSPDHFNEFSYKELKDKILPASGFKVIKATGVYLELLLFKSGNQIREDYLQRRGNINRYKVLMHLLNILGKYLPKYCLDLIIIAKKE